MLKNKTVAFNALLFILFCLSYFSCYNIVAKFYCLELYLSCLCLRVLWSQLQCFYIKLIKIVLASCHIKNYLFVITYLLEDEQELSLGMMIRCKRIYNFWCSMLVLHQFLYVLFTLRCTFYTFSGTNLLTRCRSASSCFLLFLYSRKVVQEIFSERDETKTEVPIFT